MTISVPYKVDFLRVRYVLTLGVWNSGAWHRVGKGFFSSLNWLDTFVGSIPGPWGAGSVLSAVPSTCLSFCWVDCHGYTLTLVQGNKK